MSSDPRPPFLARWILRLRLPASVRDAFEGDLEERFQRRVVDDPSGARRAYWRDALSPALRRLRREVEGMPLPPGSPPATPSGERFMNRWLRDLRYAARMLWKAPGFTAVAVISLALAIGPNTAVFSLINAVLLQDWGVEEPESLVDVYTLTRDGRHFQSYRFVYELLDEGATDVFEDVTSYTMYMGNLETEGASELVLGEMVTGNYFEVMGVPAARGRTFRPEEDATPGTHPVVVLSDRYWRDRLGAAPDVVGSQLRLNGRPYTVVGVAPPTFRGRLAPGVGTDFWVPMSMYTHLQPGQPGQGNLLITGRVRDGIDARTAVSAVETVAARFNAARPERRSPLELGAVVVSDVRLGPDFDSVVMAMAALLLAAVGLVLVVACVNLAGFLLSRATDRRKEVAVRVAMGAGRGAIVRQLMLEAALLAGLGAVLGLGLGQLALRALLGIEPPVQVPVNLDVGLDGRLLLFTSLTALVAAVVFGLVPSLRATRVPVASTLRDESGSASGQGKNRLRALLMGGQMALSTVVLITAALMLRSLQAATDIDVGFDTGPAAVVTVEGWASEYDRPTTLAFVEELRLRVEGDPRVDQLTVTGRMPLALGNISTAFDVPGVDPPPDEDGHYWQYAPVGAGYFETMGIPLLEGRGFDAADIEDGADVVVLSRALAERLWPGESAVGHVLYRSGSPDTPLQVVGVADDVKIWSLTEAPRDYMYAPFHEGWATNRFDLVARGSGDPGAAAALIRDEARAIDPELFLSEVGTMDDHLGYIYFLPRMGAVLLSLMAVLALVLASVGLYGMVSYAVARRTKEMGVRLALGADAGEIVRLVVRGGLTVVVVGGAVGLAVALGGGRLLEQFLYGIGSFDAVALLAAPTVLLLVAGAAAWIPARRATRVDPVEALRSE